MERGSVFRDRNVTWISNPSKSVVARVYCRVLMIVSRLVRGQEGSDVPNAERK
jgi:hypothetical protein